ncbi:hypothetical protein GQ43DRAFT_476397 [Delitschia confertaspora ATCC 74209]|uniref:Uncharacterized protein n=1 Tax=Delitschia confertaspora ATCC 74209 TaxID=1513339 RepID=A0A9P4MMV9_9PLEO|nr:hypothetical protein GQ43DRAFT_476397 [Delitschia confertaspora ATCC 74209]
MATPAPFPFLCLPRELRDQIYIFLITPSVSQGPRNKCSIVDSSFHWPRRSNLNSSVAQNTVETGEYMASYSAADPPRTLSDLLCVNRQVHAEMMECVERERRQGGGRGVAKMNCKIGFAWDCFFEWGVIGVVRTVYEKNEKSWVVPLLPLLRPLLPAWAENTWKKWTATGSKTQRYYSPHHQLPLDLRNASHLLCPFPRRTTFIHQLWIDVHPPIHKIETSSAPTSDYMRHMVWAICAALKRVLEKGPNFKNLKNLESTTMVEELVLNVISSPSNALTPKECLPSTSNRVEGEAKGCIIHPIIVAKDLLAVWNTIWRAENYKGQYYRVLLERIGRVKICIDGETFRIRELHDELKRGQAEGRRIAARGGW